MLIKDRLPSMTKDEAIDRLAKNGNLIRRPFVIDLERGIALVGIKPDLWEAEFSDRSPREFD